jgi:hypothetical protein
MKWFRSWPRDAGINPELKKRGRVIDSIPLLLIHNYDLTTSEDFWSIDENFALLEWDIAVSLEDRRAWGKHCEAFPDMVHAVRYPQYTENGTVWTPFKRIDGIFQLGFGMIYFPIKVVNDFIKETYDPNRKTTWFTDGEFSRWYNGKPVDVSSFIRIVHLNYSEEKVNG